MDIWTQLARFAVMETQKVNLRPFQADDFDAFHELANDTEHLAFVFPGKASKQETDYLMVHSFMKDPLGNWAIARKVDNRLIGSIRLENYDRKNAKAEIGYFLASTFWNQGLMTDVLKTICFLAFQELGLKELILVTHLENKASQKVAQKAGFVLKKQFKGSDRHSRKMRDYLAYQLTIGDYQYE